VAWRRQLAEVGIDVALTIQRALITDVVPESLLAETNAFMATNSGIGKVLGYGLGSLNLVTVLPFFYTNFRALFALVIVIVAASGYATVALVPEEVFRRQVRVWGGRDPIRGSGGRATGHLAL
jgi:predicted ferric reductase